MLFQPCKCKSLGDWRKAYALLSPCNKKRTSAALSGQWLSPVIFPLNIVWQIENLNSNCSPSSRNTSNSPQNWDGTETFQFNAILEIQETTLRCIENLTISTKYWKYTTRFEYCLVFVQTEKTECQAINWYELSKRMITYKRKARVYAIVDLTSSVSAQCPSSHCVLHGWANFFFIILTFKNLKTLIGQHTEKMLLRKLVHTSAQWL